jgi:hypothetical protein
MAELAKANPDGYTIGTLSSTGYLVQLQGRHEHVPKISDRTTVPLFGTLFYIFIVYGQRLAPPSRSAATHQQLCKRDVFLRTSSLLFYAVARSCCDIRDFAHGNNLAEARIIGTANAAHWA